MKFFLLIALFDLSVSLSSNAFAESDLETDDVFFQSSTAPYEDDELDRIHKKNDLVKTTEQQKKTETKVKDEFSSTTPDIMKAQEARMMDERIVAENKRRRKAILNKLDASSGAVHECVAKDPKVFQGSYATFHATVVLMIAADGRILDTAIKSTDIDSGEVQKCVHEVVSNLKFDEAKTDLFKKSHVEYTYKFKKKTTKSVGVKKPSRRTASH